MPEAEADGVIEDLVDGHGTLDGADFTVLERIEGITDVTGAEEGAPDLDEKAYFSEVFEGGWVPRRLPMMR
jgi:hypothetical protein